MELLLKEYSESRRLTPRLIFEVLLDNKRDINERLIPDATRKNVLVSLKRIEELIWSFEHYVWFDAGVSDLLPADSHDCFALIGDPGIEAFFKSLNVTLSTHYCNVQFTLREERQESSLSLSVQRDQEAFTMKLAEIDATEEEAIEMLSQAIIVIRMGARFQKSEIDPIAVQVMTFSDLSTKEVAD